MPSVDDTLRQAFASTDDEWVRRAASSHSAVVARHRHRQVVRRGVAATVCAVAVLAAVAVVNRGPAPRTVEPVDPSPSVSAPPGVRTPLEGTWVSGRLDADDVRAAARRAGAPKAAGAMLAEVPEGPFRVVMVVRGASLRTLVRPDSGDDEVMDEEVVSVTGRVVRLRPLHADGRNQHSWVLEGDTLTLAFESTTEVTEGGVPAEAWQRLLYDTSTFTR